MYSKTYKTIVLGGGCFWCTEAIFKSLKCIISVESGYSGGNLPDPTYDEVASGTTNHAEVVRVEYDSNIIPTKDLLEIYFHTHNPTTLNRQGNDIGTQYRSVIFYTTEDQKEIANRLITIYDSIHEFGNDEIVTKVEPLGSFYAADEYHKDYYFKNRYVPYCQIVISPKLSKLREKYTNYIKTP